MVRRSAETWFTIEIADGVDTSKPGLYEWHIEGVGSYIGRYKRYSRPTTEYVRNVRNLIAGKPYRRGKPTLFRRIHHELAAAYDAKRTVRLIILENPKPENMGRRELELIRERGVLNGSRHSPPSSALPSVNDALTEDPGLTIAWPMPGNAGAIVHFSTADEWRRFILSLDVHSSLPMIIAGKFRRAQKLYMFGWIEPDVIKAGELAALAALELALKDRYLGLYKEWVQGRGAKLPNLITLPHLLRYMVDVDGVTNEQLPIFRKSGGDPVGMLFGKDKMSLVEIRNSLAHGDPFDGLPYGGLLEHVRDLINFAYRGWIKEHTRTDQGIR